MCIRDRLISLLIIVLAIEFIVACCDCPNSDTIVLTHCKLDTELIHATNPKVSDTIAYDSLHLRLQISLYQSTCAIQEEYYSIFNAAYATTKCDCVQAYSQGDQIMNVDIIALNDFDSTILSGTNMTHYFSALAHTNTLPEGTKMNESIEFQLNRPPGQSSEQLFEVLVELSDGRTLSAETQSVFITK